MKKPKKVDLDKLDLGEEEQALCAISEKTEKTPDSSQKPKQRSVNPVKLAPFRERFKDVLNTLSERERKVLELRFGLGDGCSRTLQEVGKQFNVARERIRLIEAKALKKMRHPKLIQKLPELQG